MRALLFDMDGTLVDSLPAIFRAYEEVMESLGAESSYDEFVSFSSLSLREIVGLLSKRTSIDPSRLADAFRSHVPKCYANHVELFPGAREVLKEMQELDRTMLLVTAAERPIAEQVVEKHGLGEFFSHIVTPCNLSASKPDPTIYRKALTLGGSTPEESVAFEDSSVGIRASKGANIRSVWMNHKDEEFHPDYAHLIDHTFSNWQSATQWLKDGIKGQTR